jgi:hypothetical protein
VISVRLEAGNILAEKLQAYNLDKHISQTKPAQSALILMKHWKINKNVKDM